MDLSDTNSVYRKPLVHFGKELVKSVRDWAISEIDGILDGKSPAPGDAPIRREMEGLDPRAQEFIKKLVPMIVDTTLHYVMFMFEHPTHHGIRIAVTTSDGEVFPDLNAQSDGLAGDLLAWVQVYSKQRRQTFPEVKVEIPDSGDLDDEDS